MLLRISRPKIIYEKAALREIYPNTELFLARIFLYSD